VGSGAGSCSSPIAAWTSPASRQLAVLALSIGSYLVAIALGGNGFIAAFVGGLAFGVVTRQGAEDAVAFTEAQGSLLAIVVRTIFGITVGGSLIAGGLDLPAIAYAILSLTVVRMVPVALALVGCRFQPATVAFIGWFGPRGLASIVCMIIAVEGLHGGAKTRTSSSRPADGPFSCPWCCTGSLPCRSPGDTVTASPRRQVTSLSASIRMARCHPG
jgi:NhaP-type Na+/H+ or K+/H+ antiporter